jgi:hypothetical protein
VLHTENILHKTNKVASRKVRNIHTHTHIEKERKRERERAIKKEDRKTDRKTD